MRTAGCPSSNHHIWRTRISMSSTTAVSQTSKPLAQVDGPSRTPGIIHLPPSTPLNSKKSKPKKKGPATRSNGDGAEHSSPAALPPAPESHLTWQQQLLSNPKRPGPKFDRTAEKRDEETFGAPKERRKNKKDSIQHGRDKKDPKTPERGNAYAGPTFHNSPAPDSLPAPRFQSRVSKMSQFETNGDVSTASVSSEVGTLPMQSPLVSSPPAALPAAAPSMPAVSPVVPNHAMQPFPMNSLPSPMPGPYGMPGYYGALAPRAGVPPMMPPQGMPLPMPTGFRPRMVPPFAVPFPGMPYPVPPNAGGAPSQLTPQPAPASMAHTAPGPTPGPVPAAQSPQPAARGSQTVDSLLANMLGAPVPPRAP